ncbi:hypothetical protein [Deinococcus koreensis]|uniref:Peptidase M50 n=1 Tax=Deinococcus koreensis TaxID=2054903 RepID=A0A2K3UY04_9DEIO|nr:hypothetical protein [Deinococcus koreensis]PNY81420.1 hypothetical protein CVO96_08505 [Deinococcus koreensis]
MTPGTARRTSRLKRLGATALFGLLGAALGWTLATLLPAPSSGGALTAGLLLGLIVQILVHELGHVLLGVLGGLRVSLLAVGPLSYQPGYQPGDQQGRRTGRGLRWRPSPALGFAYLVAPPGMALPELVTRYRQMVLGGPLLGLGFTALCWWLAVILPPGGPETVAAVTALLGGGLNLLSLVPLASGGLLTDGARLRRLWPGSPTALREAAVLALVPLSRESRPRDWPAELLDAAQQPQGTPSYDAAARQYAALAALDRGDPAQAERLTREVQALVAPLPPMVQAGFLAEQAYLEARLGHVAAARQTLDALPRSAFLPSVTRHRARAAVLLAEGNAPEALAAIREARQGLDDALAAPGIEEPWLAELEAEAALLQRT